MFGEFSADGSALRVFEELADIYFVEDFGEVIKRHPKQRRIVKVGLYVTFYTFRPSFGAMGEITRPLELLPDVSEAD